VISLLQKRHIKHGIMGTFAGPNRDELLMSQNGRQQTASGLAETSAAYFEADTGIENVRSAPLRNGLHGTCSVIETPISR
jgi:hypothetical protein